MTQQNLHLKDQLATLSKTHAQDRSRLDAITGIQTWYFMSYFPGLKPLILPVHWDEYTDKIKDAALAFAAEYEQEMPKILNAIRP